MSDSILEEAKELIEQMKDEVTVNQVKPTALVATDKFSTETEMMDSAVMSAGRKAVTLKEVIDVGVTGKALQKEGVIDELTDRKEQELKEDALAKVIASEAVRIRQETDKVLEEGKKQLATLENEINSVKAAKEKLEKEADKNQAYFNSHRAVLKYAGCKEAMSITYMQVMAVIGFVIMCIIKVLLSPLIVVGMLIEVLMDIVGGVTGKMKENAGKIIASIFLVIFIIAVMAAAYYGVLKLTGVTS